MRNLITPIHASSPLPLPLLNCSCACGLGLRESSPHVILPAVRRKPMPSSVLCIIRHALPHSLSRSRGRNACTPPTHIYPTKRSSCSPSQCLRFISSCLNALRTDTSCAARRAPIQLPVALQQFDTRPLLALRWCGKETCRRQRSTSIDQPLSL